MKIASIPLSRGLVACIAVGEGCVALWLFLKALHYSLKFWGIFRESLMDTLYLIAHRSDLYRLGAESVKAVNPDTFPIKRIATDGLGLLSALLVVAGVIIMWWSAVGVYRAIGRCVSSD